MYLRRKQGRNFIYSHESVVDYADQLNNDLKNSLVINTNLINENKRLQGIINANQAVINANIEARMLAVEAQV